MYCVVETIEDGDKNCMAVPKCWVVNEKLLYPRHSKDVSSARKKCLTPQVDWLVMPCRILRDNLDSLKTALDQERESTLMSYSETENTETPTVKDQRPPDVNSLFHNQPLQYNLDNDPEPTTSKTEQYSDTANKKSCNNNDFSLKDHNYSYNTVLQEQHVIDILEPHNTTKDYLYLQNVSEQLTNGFDYNNDNYSEEYSTLNKKLDRLTESLDAKMNQIIKNQADLKATLNILMEKIIPSIKLKDYHDKPDFSLPITNINELESLEWKLKSNLDFKNQMVSFKTYRRIQNVEISLKQVNLIHLNC